MKSGVPGRTVTLLTFPEPPSDEDIHPESPPTPLLAPAPEIKSPNLDYAPLESERPHLNNQGHGSTFESPKDLVHGRNGRNHDRSSSLGSRHEQDVSGSHFNRTIVAYNLTLNFQSYESLLYESGSDLYHHSPSRSLSRSPRRSHANGRRQSRLKHKSHRLYPEKRYRSPPQESRRSRPRESRRSPPRESRHSRPQGSRRSRAERRHPSYDEEDDRVSHSQLF